MKSSAVLVLFLACLAIICAWMLVRFMSRQMHRRECEEMRRHVRRHYDPAA